MLVEIKTESSRRSDNPKRTLILRCDNPTCNKVFEKRFVQHIAVALVHACSCPCQGVLQHKGGVLDVRKRERFIKNYGVDNSLKDPTIQKRVRTTNAIRYGVPVSSQADSVKEKAKATNQERFGVDWHTQSTNFDEKSRATWLEKYGVDHPMRSGEVKAKYDFRAIWAKAHATKKNNGTYARSSVEDVFHAVLIEKFGVDNVERAVSVKHDSGTWIVDFRIKSCGAYVQFDGAYWHGLDRSLSAIKEEKHQRDTMILRAFNRDRAQDVWFVEHEMKLIRVTDIEFKRDPRACLLRIADQSTRALV